MNPVQETQIQQIPAWAEIRVTWKDAHSPDSGWHNPETYEAKDATATTLGRHWKNCLDGYLTVAGTIFESELPNPETVGDITHIPNGWITQIDIITPIPNQVTPI